MSTIWPLECNAGPLLCVSLRAGSQEASIAARLFISDQHRTQIGRGRRTVQAQKALRRPAGRTVAVRTGFSS